MHVAVLQSAYVPWRGYFDIIASVDLFIVYDDVQYSKGSWRNRNKVKLPDGSRWLTVPVNTAFGDLISDVAVAYTGKDWIEQHRGLLSQSLGRAPYFEQAMASWEGAVAERPEHLSVLNRALLTHYCADLGITTRFADSADYPLDGVATDRLLQLLQAVGATSYLSGPAAQAYLELDKFREAGIALSYKSYDYAPYPQASPGFQPDVSIIDLIANLGPDAAASFQSRTPDRKVVL
jgi:hypothetical protein